VQTNASKPVELEIAKTSVSGGKLKLNALKTGCVLERRQELRIDTPAVAMARDMTVETTRREHADRRHVVIKGQTDLLEIVGALDAPGCFSSRFHGGQEQGNQRLDDPGEP
jgi:hypothetical protein